MTAFCATAAAAALLLANAGVATASDPAFVRAFGAEVNSSGNPNDDPDICTTSCQAGNPGSSTGALQDPLNVAVGSGDVYVAESGAGRILEYMQDGEFVRAFGAGSIHHGSDVAVAASGDVYVADTLDERIDEFTHDGTFVRAFGKNVNSSGDPNDDPDVCTTSCRAGSEGSGAGAFESPEEVAVAGSGDVYVVDYENYRIAEYKQDGTFVRAFGKGVDSSNGGDVCTTSCQAGSSGSSAGALHDPEGIAAAGGADVYVTDWTDDRVIEFTQDGTYVRTFGKGVDSSNGSDVCTTSCRAGSSGSGAGALNGPADIAIAPSGQLYVSDGGNLRVAIYSPTGSFVRAFGKDVNSSGNNSENPDVCTTSCQAGTSGDGAGEFATDMWGLAAAGTGNVYVADYSNHRIDEWTPGSATPTLATQATHTAKLGQPISDTATLTGGNNPTGTVTFKAYASSTCAGAPAFTSDPVALSNGSASSGPFTPTESGSYHWTASYSGDAYNDAVVSGCNVDPAETSVVAKPASAHKPKCTLRPLSSHLKTVTVKKKKKKRHVLRLSAKCDQAATLELGGKITAKPKAKKGGKAPKQKRFKLGQVKASAGANRSLTLVVRVPKRALRLLAHGAKESAAFTLTATNANGAGTATASIAKLKR